MSQICIPFLCNACQRIYGSNQWKPSVVQSCWWSVWRERWTVDQPVHMCTRPAPVVYQHVWNSLACFRMLHHKVRKNCPYSTLLLDLHHRKSCSSFVKFCENYYLDNTGISDHTGLLYNLHAGLSHHTCLHTCHLKAIHIIPVGDMLVVKVKVTDGGNADIASIWVHYKHKDMLFSFIIIINTERLLLHRTCFFSTKYRVPAINETYLNCWGLEPVSKGHHEL